MKCQNCDEPATVHLTNIINGQKKQMHLCEACAEKKEILSHQELNLSAILQTVIGQHVGALSDELSRLTCPTCGIKYMEFKAGGRLGCPQDYEVFRVALEPLLQRIHRAGRHVGKRPPHAERHAAMAQLREQLRQAVDGEQYEEAARLRDLIREREVHG